MKIRNPVLQLINTVHKHRQIENHLQVKKNPVSVIYVYAMLSIVYFSYRLAKTKLKFVSGRDLQLKKHLNHSKFALCSLISKEMLSYSGIEHAIRQNCTPELVFVKKVSPRPNWTTNCTSTQLFRIKK